MSSHGYTALRLEDEPHSPHAPSKPTYPHILITLTSASLALLAVLSVAVLTASLPTEVPRHSRLRDTNLRYPDPYPNIQVSAALRKTEKSPKMIFPGSIVRASRDSPDTVFTNSSHVFLTPQDSMYYQWRLRDFKFDLCYISAAVPDRERLHAGNKSYLASGDLGNIEVWNVSHPERLREMSWSQRPPRIALLGTLNFSRVDQMDGWQLKSPTPRFNCPDGRYTVEITCSGCRIQLEQVFSMPALGFELQMLG